MSRPEIVERYLTLCLRAGRLIPGLVDAYYGPPDLKQQVDAEDMPDAARLHEEALSLQEAVGSEPLDPQRQRWLLAQTRALECVTERLAGTDIPWVEEVRRCFGVTPEVFPEEKIAEAHSRLDAAIPGGGELRSRYMKWSDGQTVPLDRLLELLEKMRESLRGRVREMVELPDDEQFAYELVTGESWAAFNWYLGGHKSTVSINTDVGVHKWDVPLLVAHEGYPGHHTERAAKEHLLVDQNGWLEFSVAVVTAPEALISEGIAMNAPQEGFGPDMHEQVGEVFRNLGLEYDIELMALVYELEGIFQQAGTNAAILLHQEARPRDEVQEYISKWSLKSPERAARLVDFLTDPTWRAYASSYTDGERLCKTFIDREEDGFRRLLTEPLTTEDLL